MSQHFVQIVVQPAHLVIAELEIRQTRHVADLLFGYLHPAAFLLDCLYMMRRPASTMLSDSSSEPNGRVTRVLAIWGGRRRAGAATRNSTSVTVASPSTSWLFFRMSVFR